MEMTPLPKKGADGDGADWRQWEVEEKDRGGGGSYSGILSLFNFRVTFFQYSCFGVA